MDLHTVVVWTSPWFSRVLWLYGGLLEAILGIPGPRREWPAQELWDLGVRLHWHPSPVSATLQSLAAEARP